MKKSIVLLCLFIYPLAINSQEITNDQIMKKIEQLENRVSILENIIADNSNKKTQNRTTITSDKQMWRKLNKGMDQDNVRKLLGEPLTIDAGPITRWYYTTTHFDSYVLFDNENKVLGWREPE